MCDRFFLFLIYSIIKSKYNGGPARWTHGWKRLAWQPEFPGTHVRVEKKKTDCVGFLWPPHMSCGVHAFTHIMRTQKSGLFLYFKKDNGEVLAVDGILNNCSCNAVCADCFLCLVGIRKREGFREKVLWSLKGYVYLLPGGIKKHSEKGSFMGTEVWRTEPLIWAIKRDRRLESWAGPDRFGTWTYTAGVWDKRMKSRGGTAWFSYRCLCKCRDLKARDSLLVKLKSIL